MAIIWWVDLNRWHEFMQSKYIQYVWFLINYSEFYFKQKKMFKYWEKLYFVLLIDEKYGLTDSILLCRWKIDFWNVNKEVNFGISLILMSFKYTLKASWSYASVNFLFTSEQYLPIPEFMNKWNLSKLLSSSNGSTIRHHKTCFLLKFHR